MKVGRNQPCPCGSGLKFKRCHGSIQARPSEGEMKRTFDRINADQRIRDRQWGLGKPLIAPKLGERQFVAIGNQLMYSDKWKTFADFLGDYIKRVIGFDWGNAELKKPFEERNPLIQWYDTYCRYQQEVIKQPGQVSNSTVIGVVACYLGVAYSLYLLDHNVELQARLLNRLRDVGNFQGAYYELLVANVLIRAGFELTLEDETDGSAKHCEFAAVSKRTGKKYWVEAKMRGVVGLLGRTQADGGPDDKPNSKLIQHLNGALAKPAQDERLIFIDLNGELPADASEENRPAFMEKAIKRLQKYERDGEANGKTAYVFVTNIAFHRNLRGNPGVAVAPFGLGIPDFNREGYFRMSDRYMQEQKHGDAIRIAESFVGLSKFPSAFDGRLPSEAYDKSERVFIGEVYDFGDDIGVALVTTATVAEQWKAAVLGVTRQSDGTAHVIRKPMTEGELADWRDNSDAYFGRLEPKQRVNKTPYEFFESLVEIHKTWTQEQLLDRLKGYSDFEALKLLPHEHLVAVYCEVLVAMIQRNQGAKPAA